MPNAGDFTSYEVEGEEAAEAIASRTGRGDLKSATRFTTYATEASKKGIKVSRDIDKILAMPTLKCTEPNCKWETTIVVNDGMTPAERTDAEMQASRRLGSHVPACKRDRERFDLSHHAEVSQALGGEGSRRPVAGVSEDRVREIVQDSISSLREGILGEIRAALKPEKPVAKRLKKQRGKRSERAKAHRGSAESSGSTPVPPVEPPDLPLGDPASEPDPS